MIGRARYAFSTLAGPWMILPLAVLEVVNLAQRGAPWRGEALWTTDWLAIVLFVAGPIAAGFAAVDAARLSRPGNVHLAVTTSRSRWVYSRAALWCALPLVAVHTLAFVGAHVVGGTHLGDLVRVDLVVGFLVQCVAFVWYAALGSLIGRFAPSVLAGILGATAGLFLFYALSSRGEGFDLLRIGGATVSRLGVEWNLVYVGLQLAVMGISAALVLLAPIVVRAGRALPSRTAVASLVVAVGMIAVTHGTGPTERNLLSANPEPPDMCFGSEPTICFYRQHERLAFQVEADLQRLFHAARTNGYDVLVPKRLEQESRSYVPPTGVTGFTIPVSVQVGAGPDDWAYMQDLVTAGHCEALSGIGDPPPEVYWQNLGSMLVTWLHLTGEERDPVGEERILTPDEVATILDAWERCELDVEV